jgi:hypothetical protein
MRGETHRGGESERERREIESEEVIFFKKNEGLFCYLLIVRVKLNYK